MSTLSRAVREWSAEQNSILGLPPDCVANAGLFASLIHPDDRERVEQQYRRAYQAESGGVYDALFRIVRASDGAERWVQATGRVHFDPAGKPIRGVGTLADVTERRSTELALQARTAELETVLDTVPIAVWIAHDVEGRRISGNRAAVSRLRLAASDNLSLAAPMPERPRPFPRLQNGVELEPEATAAAGRPWRAHPQQ